MSNNKRIEDKLDILVSDMGQVKITLAEQHVVLTEHQSRSTKLEAIVLPLHKKTVMLEGILKFIGILGLLAGVIESIRMLAGK